MAAETFIYSCEDTSVPRSDEFYREQLMNYGVMVVTNDALTARAPWLHEQLLAAMADFPEYKTKRKEGPPQQYPLSSLSKFPSLSKAPTDWVGGAFGALNNASSFHNPFVRIVRQWAMSLLIPIFGGMAPPGFRLEQCMDRMLYRPSHRKYPAEAWHRDESKLAEPTDLTFGGWINTDMVPQFFSCVPGTHKEQRGDNGFNIIGKEQHADLQGRSRKVCIPPGAIIVFFEHIIHEVYSSPGRVRPILTRLFLGWRITNDTKALLEKKRIAKRELYDVDSRIDNQAPMWMKSGQLPFMYPGMTWMFQRQQLERWSNETFVPEALTIKTVGSGPHKGEAHTVVYRVMPSLFEMNLPLYQPYGDDERAMYHPNEEWSLLKPGDLNTKQSIKLRPAVNIQQFLDSLSDEDDDDDDDDDDGADSSVGAAPSRKRRNESGVPRAGSPQRQRIASNSNSAMRALTVRQPAASALISGPKNIENRTWAIPANVQLPTWIAITSSKSRPKQNEIDHYNTIMRGLGQPAVAVHTMPRGALIGFMHLTGSVDAGHGNPWFTGPIGWTFDNSIELPRPVPVAGRLGLFKFSAVPDAESVLARVRAQLSAAQIQELNL